MKNILVPVGTMSNAITNLQYAIHLASINGATVYLINLYKEFSKVGGLTKVNQLIIEESEELLDRVTQEVDFKGVNVVVKSIKGDPYEGIARISEKLEIDLIILSPQSIEIVDEVYLGNITGKIVKQTNIPVLIIPKDYIFRKIETILLAFKRGKLNNPQMIEPLKELSKNFSASINLLLVKTPNVTDEDAEIDPALLTLNREVKITENATIFQGILEHFQSHNPDMLCVFRRKRGFFEKLWEKNTVLKKDFHTSKPLLILKGQD